MADRHIRLFLCGDVMTGRGIDQILPHPCPPRLFEPYVRDACDYVQLAREAHGPIPCPADYSYIWGEALDEIDRAGADLRIVNLETSITRSDDYWSAKEIHYRMSPDNMGCLTAARIDCCILANNHVLDWGYEGLSETLETLDRAGFRHAGAGADDADAQRPAVLDVPGKGRVLLFSFGSATSGIPLPWAATTDRAGVNLLPDLSVKTADDAAIRIARVKEPGDLVVASIHWGSNWGHEIPSAQIHFAHRLIEKGVDLVHGHSSPHPKALEVYQGHPILYGCGDLLNDYEGISGFEAFRSDLATMYFVTLDPVQDTLVELRLVPMQRRQFRLRRASPSDARWLCQTLSREGKAFGTEVSPADDNSLSVGPPHAELMPQTVSGER